MPDAQKRILNTIIGRTLIQDEAFFSDIRRQIINDAVSPGLSDAEILDRARDHLEALQEFRAQLSAEAAIAANVAGANMVLSRIGQQSRDLIGGEGASDPPRMLLTGGDADDQPLVRLPLIDQAAEELNARNIFTRERFDQLRDEERAKAFTVARQGSTETIGRIRDELVEGIQQGTSLRDFRNRLDAAMITSPLGPGHIENVYRTNLQAAFHRAHDELAGDPIVADIFPYQAYIPIRDGRTRDNHLALEKLGLSGTNIYRRDDPFWDVFTPPWDYQCRCSVNLMTIEAAARKGVAEARRWLRTGESPENPEFRLDKIPFRPSPDFAGGRAA